MKLEKVYKVEAGTKVGRLTVLHYSHKAKSYEEMWVCKCDCGNVKAIGKYKLERGHTRSCGCLKDEQVKGLKTTNTTHGMSDTRLYRKWRSMKNRCLNPKDHIYKYYGGRGIKVCDEWQHDFSAFQRWMIENGYDPDAPKWECTIDRIDANGDYSPHNCRVVPMSVQHHNKRNTVWLTHNGVKKSLSEWCKEYGLKYGTCSARMRKYNFTTSEEILFGKKGE